MPVLLSANHPFPLAAVAFNSYDHVASVSHLLTSTGVGYDLITYTPRGTPGFDYNQFFTYAGAASGPTVVTYSFSATVAQARAGFLAAGAPDFTAELTTPRLLNGSEQANARAALREVASFANLQFAEKTGFADINYFQDPRFGGNGFARGDITTAWSPGGTYTLDGLIGMVVVGTDNDPFFYHHELGHVLTLKHVGPFQDASETPFLPAQFFDSKYSIMYYDVTHANLSDPGERVNLHFQLFDVYALQQRFGANMSWKSGNDTYTSASFDGNRQVLWDAGGNDTLDFSAQSVNQIIDLNGGAFSTLGGFFPPTENLSIAYGAVIENAVGGSGADHINGNSSRNSLSGRAGNDTLDGASGHDTLDGSAGNDRLIGGSGNDNLVGGRGADALIGGAGVDKADYTRATAGVTANLATSRGSAGDATGDTYSSIEVVSGSNFGDTLTGGNLNDDLRGRGGSDLLSGGAANDKLNGGSGNDTLDGGAGNDTLTGGGHNDTFQFSGNFGADTITDMNEGADIRDVIRLIGLGSSFDTFAEVLAATTQVGMDAVINFGGGNTITLTGIDKNNLHANDFLFG